MSARPPVDDWATDFDHLHEQWAATAPAIWDDLRQRCPVAHTNRFFGAYLPTRYDDVVDVARNPTTFTNRITVVNDHDPARTNLVAPPITTDPPDHTGLRRAVLPPFSPKEIDALEPYTRRVCHDLIDRIAGQTRADAAVDYAQHIPVAVIAHQLGLPQSDANQFRTWVHEVLEIGQGDVEVARRANREVLAYFDAQLTRRETDPGEDLVTWVLHAQAEDRPYTRKEMIGTLYLLLLAGIDTTWSSIGAALWHLATNPADRERLVAEPELIPTACEEFLRFYAPVTMARLVAEDSEIGGCPVTKGERVLLAFPAANRDPAQFIDADRVVIDRVENRHVAFGAGIHRCLGSNLARMELQVAVEVWLERLPRFELTEPETVIWSTGQVRGPRVVPVLLG